MWRTYVLHIVSSTGASDLKTCKFAIASVNIFETCSWCSLYTHPSVSWHVRITVARSIICDCTNMADSNPDEPSLSDMLHLVPQLARDCCRHKGALKALRLVHPDACLRATAEISTLTVDLLEPFFSKDLASQLPAFLQGLAWADCWIRHLRVIVHLNMASDGEDEFALS